MAKWFEKQGVAESFKSDVLAGMSGKDLAEKYQVSSGAIQIAKIAMGLQGQGAKQGRKPGSVAPFYAGRESELADLFARNRTIAQIAEHFGVSGATVMKAKNALGLTGRGRGRPAQVKVGASEPEAGVKVDLFAGDEPEHGIAFEVDIGADETLSEAV